jgi:5-methylcytosine-specific restriction endonuclease McrA
MKNGKFEIEEFKRAFIKLRPFCEVCNSRFTEDIHHKFSQGKSHKQLYGKKLHHPKNLMAVCKACHPYAPKWNEKKFCEELNIRPLSKSGLWKVRNETECML